ncbi:glycosyltransferase family 4 protein [Bacillus cihuensis]|uniref:glycosyltransferase family 4 protein n=1 Tax=Bacillus cihuensis TaxID=1208599 RepID=UPI0004096D88|nr:glycosyltransferase family 4 protein [Bacillus cihuensis]
MKILMICTEKLPVPPVLGGAIQTYISGNLPYLSQFHEITVLGISEPSLPNLETINGVHYVRVPGQILEIYREGVIKYLESTSFDLIHIFNRPRLILPVRKAAPEAKITLSMHNDMFNPDKISPEEATAALEEVSNIVTVSDYVGNVIKNLYPQATAKISTIYSGVDTEQFLPGNHPKMQKIRNEIRREHGLENKTVILFAGRLSHNKGVDRLIRALPELTKKFKDLAVVIVGSSWFSKDEVTDYVAYVRAMTKKLSIPVVTTGFVSPSVIQNWFAAADLFVCTSQWNEPLARVHYEAMAAGLPILTTARGGNAEVIQLNENGLVVENPDNPVGFVDKITEIIADKSKMKNMGIKGRELAVSLYKWDRVASEILAVWDKAIHTSSSSGPQDLPNNDEQLISKALVMSPDPIEAKPSEIKSQNEQNYKMETNSEDEVIEESIITLDNKPEPEPEPEPVLVPELEPEPEPVLVPELELKPEPKKEKGIKNNRTKSKSRTVTVRDLIKESLRDSLREMIVEQTINDMSKISSENSIKNLIRELQKRKID